VKNHTLISNDILALVNNHSLISNVEIARVNKEYKNAKYLNKCYISYANNLEKENTNLKEKSKIIDFD